MLGHHHSDDVPMSYVQDESFDEGISFTIRPSGSGGGGDGVDEVPEEMAALLARRLAARESKDWATADAVRDEIKELGYTVKVRQLLRMFFHHSSCDKLQRGGGATR